GCRVRGAAPATARAGGATAERGAACWAHGRPGRQTLCGAAAGDRGVGGVAGNGAPSIAASTRGQAVARVPAPPGVVGADCRGPPLSRRAVAPATGVGGAGADR